MNARKYITSYEEFTTENIEENEISDFRDLCELPNLTSLILAKN